MKGVKESHAQIQIKDVPPHTKTLVKSINLLEPPFSGLSQRPFVNSSGTEGLITFTSPSLPSCQLQKEGMNVPI